MIDAALIGLGGIAWKYDARTQLKNSFALSQAGAMLRHPNVRLVGGFSPNKTDREQFQTWSGLPAFDNLEAMLDKTQPKLIGVCSPTVNHFENFLSAVDCGAQIIWLEKPAAASLTDACSMQDMAKEKSITVGVNYFRRTLPAYQYCKSILDTGRFGTCQLLQILYSPGLMRNGCHLVDQLFFLTGANDYELLWLEKANDPDNPLFGLRLSTGHIAVVCGRDLPYHTNTITMIFDQAILSMDKGGRKIHVEKSIPNPITPGFYKLETDNTLFPKIGGIDGHMDYALADLLLAHQEKRQPASNLTTALLTQRILEEILKGQTR